MDDRLVKFSNRSLWVKSFRMQVLSSPQRLLTSFNGRSSHLDFLATGLRIRPVLKFFRNHHSLMVDDSYFEQAFTSGPDRAFDIKGESQRDSTYQASFARLQRGGFFEALNHPATRFPQSHLTLAKSSSIARHPTQQSSP